MALLGLHAVPAVRLQKIYLLHSTCSQQLPSPFCGVCIARVSSTGSARLRERPCDAQTAPQGVEALVGGADRHLPT